MGASLLCYEVRGDKTATKYRLGNCVAAVSVAGAYVDKCLHLYGIGTNDLLLRTGTKDIRYQRHQTC